MKAGINLITFGKMKLKDMGKDASAIGFIGIPDGEIKIPIEK
jgi:Na+-transporting methylmalonyl-CoA/oxaloacetate decarboxylase beta subunit